MTLLYYALTWPAIGFLTWLYLVYMLPEEDDKLIVLIGCLVFGPIIAISLIYEELRP